MVGPVHWAITARAGRAYNSEPGRRVWGTLGMLRAMATAVRTEMDLAVLALVSSLPFRGFGLGRLPTSAERTAASQAGPASTTAKPRGGGSPPRGNLGGAVATAPAGVRGRTAQPNTCRSSPRWSSSAACTTYCGVHHGSESAGTVGGGSQRYHGSTGSPHLRRVHLESMDIAAAGMGVRSTRARLEIRAPRPGPLATPGGGCHHAAPILGPPVACWRHRAAHSPRRFKLPYYHHGRQR